jgi:L-lysine exporter family protein LysE/ArgO
VPSAVAALGAGLGLGLSLIVAIGAQNAFVLRQGLRRELVPAVVGICIVSDAVLIAAGVGGAGVLLTRVSWLPAVVRLAGAAFLLCYGLLAARRAVRPGALRADPAGAASGLLATVTACLAFTWLNPHVYLDTVVLLGSVGGTWGGQRWWFAAGAAVGSALWFSALGFGAALLRPVFARPRAWRLLDGAIAVVMVALAVVLVLSA